jgi:spermidine synthase
MEDAGISPSTHPYFIFEEILPGFKQGYEVKEVIFEGRSSYQEIRVVETRLFGRMMLLDGAVQVSERDEFVYHEMLVYPSLLSSPASSDVLVIGGGDGGTLKHVLSYRDVKRAVMVEVDPLVVEVSRRYLPSISGGVFDDERATLLFQNGMDFIRGCEGKFDLIIVDSTDPVGEAEILFSEEFYGLCEKALSEGGIVVTQSGSPYFQIEELRMTRRRMRKFFPIVRTYLAPVLVYPGVLWSFTVGSKKVDPSTYPITMLQEKIGWIVPAPRYYTPDVHIASFKIPRMIEEALERDEGSGLPF